MIKFLVLGFMSLIMMTGCEKLVVKSPTELIHPPKLAVDQEELREVVDQMLPDNAQLTSGIGEKEVAAINYIDLDQDGGDEAIVFYRSEGQEFFAGVMILKYTENGWEIHDIKNEIASDVEEVHFQDVTNNGIKEIIVGYVGEQNFDKYLVVYRLREDQSVTRAFEKSYSELAIADFDYDDQVEIVLFQLDRNVSATAELYKFKKEDIYLLNEYEMNTFVSNYDNISVGNLYENDIGIVVDFRVGIHSASSIILKVEKNRLVEVVKKDKGLNFRNKIAKKNYFIKSQDIDADGIIEIGEFIKPIGYETTKDYNIPYIVIWKTWDGDESLILDRESYINYENRYRFLFPKKWNDRVTIVENKELEYEYSQQYVYLTDDGKELLPLYTLVVVDKKQWGNVEADLDKNGENYEVLAQNTTKIYIMIDTKYGLEDKAYKAAFDLMKLSKNEIMESFDFLKD